MLTSTMFPWGNVGHYSVTWVDQQLPVSHIMDSGRCGYDIKLNLSTIDDSSMGASIVK